MERPRAFARDVGAGLGEYLARALSHQATLAEPKDLAWLLASYARDGLSRLEAAGNPASLAALRSALEETLGIRVEGERGRGIQGRPLTCPVRRVSVPQSCMDSGSTSSVR